MAAGKQYVFDANVIVSALLLPDSLPRRAFDKAYRQGKILLSAATILELDDVLRRPRLDRYLHEDERIDFLLHLIRESVITPVTVTITDCRETKDSKYLELAVSARATCLVTGDQDLLVLHPYRDIPIVTPRVFLEGDL